MKRIIAVLLTLFLAGMPLQALAGERHFGDDLYAYSYFTDTKATGEYTSDTTSRPLEMEVDDYVMLSPVHRIVTSLVSYQGVTATSSNPEVVAAIPKYESTGNMGVSLHAMKPGEATVTLSFGTYLTRAGAQKYNDKRGQTQFSQTIEVTVVDPSKVSLKLELRAPDGTTAQGVTMGMLRMKDTLSKAERDAIKGDINEAVVEYGTLPATTAWGYLKGWFKSGFTKLASAAGMYCSTEIAVDGVAKALTAQVPRAMEFLYDGYDFSTSRIEDFRFSVGALSRIEKAYIYAKCASMQVPTYFPGALTLKVTVENNTPYTASISDLVLDLDDHLSTGGLTGPWGEKQTLARSRRLDPGEKLEYERSISPRFVYGTLSPGKKILVYNADINASCDYEISEKERSGSLDESVTVPVYSTITDEQLQLYKKALWTQYQAAEVDAFTSLLLGGAFNGYVKWFGYEKFTDVFAVACPVEVTVSDRSGDNQVVIAGDGDCFSDGVITAYADGETKYVVLPRDRADDYSVSVRATDDGSMSVLAWQQDRYAGFSGRYFENIPLKAGDTFAVTANPQVPRELARQDGDGGQVPLEPSLDFDETLLLSKYLEQGYREDAVQACADLLLSGAEIEIGRDADADVDRVRFGAMLEGILRYCVPGAESGAASDSGNGPLTVADGLDMADGLLRSLSLYDQNSDWDWATIELDLVELGAEEDADADPEAAESAAEAEAEAPKDAGLSRSYGLDRGLDGEAALTEGDAVRIADRALNCAVDIGARNALIADIAEAYSSHLEWNNRRASGFLYGTEWEDEGLTLKDFGLWEPDESFRNLVELDPLVAYQRKVFNYYRDLNGISDTLDSILEAGYELALCPELEGYCKSGDGIVFRWIPFCWVNEAGEIYEDAVYLAMLAAGEGPGNAYLEANRFGEGLGDANARYFLVANQEAVAAVLGLTVSHSPTQLHAATAFSELSEGSQGLEVEQLSYRLYRLKYLEESYGRAYDAALTEAVRRFQADYGLEQTGVADAETLARLYAVWENEPAFRSWVERHYSRSSCETTIRNMVDLSLNGNPETLKKLMSSG